MSVCQAAPEPLIPVARAARNLGLSYTTLRRLVRSGRVASTTIAGTVRVRLTDIRRSIQERQPD